MPIIENQRPGVYSRYDTTSQWVSPRSSGSAAVVARAAGGEPGRRWEFTALSQLAEAFPPDSGGAVLRGCVEILLRSGVSKVHAVAVEEDYYEDALELLETVENIRALVCDCADEADLNALKQSMERCAENRRERVAYAGAEPSSAVALAEEINSERVVLCCPASTPCGGGQASACYTAAALAGKVVAQGDPVWNFNGETFLTVRDPEPLTEPEIQALLAAGVTVFEQRGGAAECIRAVTTRTKTGGETDYALRGLNAVLCIDDVMRELRSALKACLRGMRLTTGTLQAVQSQAVVVLAERMDRSVIESYQPPQVYSHREDPTVCVVELAFAIAHVVSQIHLTAHIQV